MKPNQFCFWWIKLESIGRHPFTDKISTINVVAWPVENQHSCDSTYTGLQIISVDMSQQIETIRTNSTRWDRGIQQKQYWAYTLNRSCRVVSTIMEVRDYVFIIIFRVRRRKFNHTAGGFQIPVSFLYNPNWLVWHPALINTHGWITVTGSWRFFHLVVEINLVQCRKWFGSLPWGKRLTLASRSISVEESDVFKIKDDDDNQGSNWRGVGGPGTPQFSCSFHCDPPTP